MRIAIFARFINSVNYPLPINMALVDMFSIRFNERAIMFWLSGEPLEVKFKTKIETKKVYEDLMKHYAKDFSYQPTEEGS